MALKEQPVIALGIVAIVAILVGGGVWWKTHQSDFFAETPFPVTNNQNILQPTEDPKDPPSAKKQELPPSTIPQEFPKTIPLEQGGAVLQNYNASVGGIKEQSTRVFVTQKSLDENQAMYARFFKDNGWTIVNTIVGKTYRILSATKNGERIVVIVDENTISKQKTVNITYTPVLPAPVLK